MKSKLHTNRGMTYVELIVVLSIFAILSGVAIYNYGAFQAKVDIKNLASDIALKIVEAQKSALSGKFPPLAQQGSISNTWKPSYGIFIDTAADNKSFIYFVDLGDPQNGNLDDLNCNGNGECLEKISIAKGDYISALARYTGATPTALNNLTITFKRPNSSAIIKSDGALLPTSVEYVQITLTSPRSSSNNTAVIKLYPSGRVQIN